MRPVEALDSLSRLGVRVRLAGDGSLFVPRAQAERPEARPFLDALRADRQATAEVLKRRATEDVARVLEALGSSGPGWIAIRSRTLGQTVLFVRDRIVEVPSHLTELPRYSLAELHRLLDGGATRDHLQRVHVPKRGLDPSAEIMDFETWGIS